MRSALIGAVCGLAWAAGLRGLMAELAGPQSQVSWYGTFVQILLPGVLTGALLGHAKNQKLVLAPLLFAVGVFASPAAFDEQFFAGGVGGGAIACRCSASRAGTRWPGGVRCGHGCSRASWRWHRFRCGP